MPNSPAPEASASPKVYHCGTLTYTPRQLAILFIWLLWGDFCYMLMETVVPSIMPLKFQGLGASNTQIGLISGTIPAIVYSVLNPIISFKSDRFRSRWGRRIPFIVISLPFLVLFLMGLGFSESIGGWVHGHLGAYLETMSPNSVTILIIGILLVAFTFFNTFVTSTFWYLFNDVVPDHLLARFMSWFRMISMISNSLYSFCIFRYAKTHSTEILVGAALLYLFGFGLMCLNVKEGKYPPPPPNVDGETGPLSSIKTYAEECLSIKHYWFQWIASFTSGVSMGVSSFGLFFALAVGLSMEQIGYIGGINGLVISVLVLGTGWLADRYHPIRVVIAGNLFGLFIALPATLIWLFWHPAPNVAFWVYLCISMCLTNPKIAMLAMGDPPLLMRLFPHERFGQFCSINAIWRSAGTIIGGSLAGIFLDTMTRFVGKERAYFYIPLWDMFFAIPSCICLILLYRSWKRHGGDDSYVPPMIANTAQAPIPTASS